MFLNEVGENLGVLIDRQACYNYNYHKLEFFPDNTWFVQSNMSVV